MIRRPPRSTRTDTLFPYTTLFRSALSGVGRHRNHAPTLDTDCGQSTPVTHTLVHSRLACAALRYCQWAGDVPTTHWRSVAGNAVRLHRPPPSLPDQPWRLLDACSSAAHSPELIRRADAPFGRHRLQP